MHGMVARLLQDQQREEPSKVSPLDAYFALVKGNLGPGVLALPFAFSQTGWAAGLPVLLIVVAQGVYAMLALVECKEAIARPDVAGLGDVAHYALGVAGRHLADVFVFILQSGCCSVFVHLVAGNLAGASGLVDRTWMTLLMAPAFAVLALLRFVAQLGWLNKLGTTAMILAVAVGTACGASKLVQVGQHEIMLRSAPNRPVTDPIMLASSVFFAFEGLGIVLPIRKEMARPQEFPKAVVFASATLAVAFLCVSATCGIAYRGLLRSGSIVAFLAAQPWGGPGHAVLEVVNHLVTVAVFLTFPLQLLPASEILAGWLGGCSGGRPSGAGVGDEEVLAAPSGRWRAPAWAWQRLALVAATVVLSMTVQNVALLVSLFGAVGQTGLGMLAPLCHLALMRSGDLPWSRPRCMLDAVIAGLCVLIMVFGTYHSLKDILKEW